MIREFSAGGVVYRKQDNNVLWMVVQHSGYMGWIFPKGHVEKGETSEEAAIREVKEETGIEAKIVQKIGETQYFYTRTGVKRFKTAKFFLMEYVSGDGKEHDLETSAIEWLSYEGALKKLTFKDEKKMLEEARSFLTGRGVMIALSQMKVKGGAKDLSSNLDNYLYGPSSK